MTALPTHGRPVLITGCSSGIGLCVAHGLKQRGYRVFASARKARDVAKLKADGFESLQLDLTDSASIRDALDALLVATGGQLYALFNNAAYGQPGAVEDLRRDVLREQFESNLFGTHELTCRVIPVMRDQGQGRIIMNSSVLGFVCMPYRGAYNASKYALEGLTDTLRLELAGSGVEVSLIQPGPIRSKFRENALAAFKQHIDTTASVHRQHYVGMAQKFAAQGPVMPFTLGPEAVLVAVIKALEAARPRARYPVTVPTHLFAWLKRLLPDRLLDRILARG